MWFNVGADPDFGKKTIFSGGPLIVALEYLLLVFVWLKHCLEKIGVC